jgi:glucoside 3-dehydrogenase (cytochrome c) hitch-hiker subunit
MPVDRRQVLKKLAAGGLGAATAPLWSQHLSALALAHADPHAHTATKAAAAPWKPKLLDAHQNESVITISELIIPQTDTPGAKAAQVNQFIDLVLAEAPAADRTAFLNGLAWMDTRARERFGTDFVSARPEQQTSLLTSLSDPENKSEADQVGREFFQSIKSLTVTGYYTTEVGLRQELGEDGTLFLAAYPGCQHPEHRG